MCVFGYFLLYVVSFFSVFLTLKHDIFRVTSYRGSVARGPSDLLFCTCTCSSHMVAAAAAGFTVFAQIFEWFPDVVFTSLTSYLFVSLKHLCFCCFTVTKRKDNICCLNVWISSQRSVRSFVKRRNWGRTKGGAVRLRHSECFHTNRALKQTFALTGWRAV